MSDTQTNHSNNMLHFITALHGMQTRSSDENSVRLSVRQTHVKLGPDIGCQLLLITNRKPHTGFRLLSTSMTLNDLERRNNPYFAFFSPNSIALQADYVTVVEDRPIMSIK